MEQLHCNTPVIVHILRMRVRLCAGRTLHMAEPLSVYNVHVAESLPAGVSDLDTRRKAAQGKKARR